MLLTTLYCKDGLLIEWAAPLAVVLGAYLLDHHNKLPV